MARREKELTANPFDLSPVDILLGQATFDPTKLDQSTRVAIAKALHTQAIYFGERMFPTDETLAAIYVYANYPEVTSVSGCSLGPDTNWFTPEFAKMRLAELSEKTRAKAKELFGNSVTLVSSQFSFEALEALAAITTPTQEGENACLNLVKDFYIQAWNKLKEKTGAESLI